MINRIEPVGRISPVKRVTPITPSSSKTEWDEDMFIQMFKRELDKIQKDKGEQKKKPQK